MFLQIENFLTSAEVTAVAEIARQAKFVDGKRSNPHNPTKDSAIADPADPVRPIVERLIKKYPYVHAQLLIGDIDVGPNPKVNNLMRSYRLAAYD